MQMVWSVIKPYKLDDVREALLDIGISGMTVIEAAGFGRQKGHTQLYRGAEYVVDFLSKTVVILLVPDNLKDQVVKVIEMAAQTGKIGDGIVWTIPFDAYKRIRTGESIDNDGSHLPDEQ